MHNFEERRIAAYFAHVASRFVFPDDVTVVCVAHMVPNTVHFLPAVAAVIQLGAILPKPKSEESRERLQLEHLLPETPFIPLRREWSCDAGQVVADLAKAGVGDQKLVLVDIGAYFVDSADALAEVYPGEFLGILEGTENGLQKYEAKLPRNVPVATVARSPLKLPEDYLVGASVVFSVEAVLRTQAQILQTRTACVIGFGRVGRAIASVLRGRGISTVVHDVDPIATAEAAAQGFQVFRQIDSALQMASLVLCATGNRALDGLGFAALRTGAVVGTVTSADDELDIEALGAYQQSPVSDVISRYDEEETGRYFWLINDGNAANFIHGAVIGPAIQLIEGEKFAAISKLAQGVYQPGKRVHELGAPARKTVARVWTDHFVDD